MLDEVRESLPTPDTEPPQDTVTAEEAAEEAAASAEGLAETAAEDPFAETEKILQSAVQSPADSTPPEEPSIFFSDSAQMPQQEEPQKPKKNILGVLLLVLMTLAVVGFSLFCIIWDIRRGTPSGGYVAGDVIHVQIGQQKKPVKQESLVDENGRYTVAGIAEAVMPSIVEIYTYKVGELVNTGSGILLSEDGYLVTNSHVVTDGDSYSVTLHDGKKYDGKLIGHDAKSDIAVIKIEAQGLQPAVLGDSDEVQLGEEVCALGNPARLSGSISSGIVSGVNRQIQAQDNAFVMECIQTDAAISSGNSGGALVNLYGQVIGITSSKYTSNMLMGVSYEGLGFAITINAALPIITELIEKGYISGRVRIGIQFYEADIAAQMEEVIVPEEFNGGGILVMGISEDSDLAQTTFKTNDWMLKMNGKPVSDYDSVLEAIQGCVAGDKIHAHCAHVDDKGEVTYYEIDFTLMEDKSGDY